MIVDSHCHLVYQDDKSEVEQKINRANKIGVSHFLNISTKSSEFQLLEEVSDNFSQIFFTLGIHPHESNETNSKTMSTIRNKINNKKLIGIGETGLDFYYNHADKKTQINSLEMHIDLAQELDLPLIIHMRDAENELIRVFKNRLKNKLFTGVIHCFTGSLNFAREILEMDFYISASGIVTFKKSQELRETFKQIPINKLLVETDSPFLSPEPLRGKKNEPAFITHTIKKLSELYNIDYDSLCDSTTKNFFSLFSKVSIK